MNTQKRQPRSKTPEALGAPVPPTMDPTVELEQDTLPAAPRNVPVISTKAPTVNQAYLDAHGIRPFMNVPLASHAYSTHAVTVPKLLSPEVLESPDMWRHCAKSLRAGSEVRVTALDGSFYALVYVVYVRGSDALVRVIHYTELEVVDYSITANQPYYVELRVGSNWCVVKRETGEILFGDFPSQSKAYQALEDHIRALRS